MRIKLYKGGATNIENGHCEVVLVVLVVVLVVLVAVLVVLVAFLMVLVVVN